MITTLCSFHCNSNVWWCECKSLRRCHMIITVSQITANRTICTTVCSDYYQRQYQRPTLLALCEGNPTAAGRFPSQRASNVERKCVCLMPSLWIIFIGEQHNTRIVQRDYTLSCFVAVWYPCSFVSFWVTSLALGQSYDCPSAWSNPKDIGKCITWIHENW